jgi:hypothetical protein
MSTSNSAQEPRSEPEPAKSPPHIQGSLANVFWGTGIDSPKLSADHYRRVLWTFLGLLLAAATIGGVVAGLVSGTGSAVLVVLLCAFTGLVGWWWALRSYK